MWWRNLFGRQRQKSKSKYGSRNSRSVKCRSMAVPRNLFLILILLVIMLVLLYYHEVTSGRYEKLQCDYEPDDTQETQISRPTITISQQKAMRPDLEDIYETLNGAMKANKSLSQKQMRVILDKLNPIMNVPRVPKQNFKEYKEKSLDISNSTILLDFTSGIPNNLLLHDMIRNLEMAYPRLNTLIGITPIQVTLYETALYAVLPKGTIRIKPVVIETVDPQPGVVWNTLIAKVKTPLVLIGRGMLYFDKESQLDKMIDRLKAMYVAIVGGAYRYVNGHWHIGCQQSAMRNYSLVYTSGYHNSKASCLYCDHVDGPFLAYTEIVKEISFSEKLDRHTLYHDFFLRVSQMEYRSRVCPYAMFHVMDRPDPFAVRSWVEFANKWNFDHIIIDNVKIQIPCSQQTFHCSGSTLEYLKLGIGWPPCCLQDLADQIKFLFEFSEQNGIMSAVGAGTLLGALKFNGILPWELDADIFFMDIENVTYNRAVTLKPLFLSAGYKIVETSFGQYKSFELYKKDSSWVVEWYGGLKGRDHTHEYYKELGLEPTKINLDGSWLRTFPNPGLSVWNDYKPEIFRHSQHNRVHLIRYDARYRPRSWLKCKKPAPGGHNCLEQHSGDGNLGFGDPVP